MPATAPDRFRSTLTVPNVVTMIRILMALAAAVLFATRRAEPLAVALCIVAALLDIFDGWYARTFSQCSHLGEHLDPLADKLLMTVVYAVIGIALDSALVWTLLALIALREAAMTVFRSYSYRRYARYIPANRWGKVKMILQSAVGLGILACAFFINGGIDVVPTSIVVAPLLAILAVSYISAVVYLRNWRAVRARYWRAEKLPLAGFEGSDRMVVGK